MNEIHFLLHDSAYQCLRDSILKDDEKMAVLFVSETSQTGP